MRSLVLLLSLAAWPLLAGESAILTNGSRLHADRHELVDSTIRLYTGAGYIEMDASKIQGFEADPETASVAPAPLAPVAKAPAVVAPIPLTPAQLADAAADKYGLPRELVRSVMRVESSFQPNAVSPKGAI